MFLTDVRIKLCPPGPGRLRAFCALTFDNTFVIRDVKLIDGNDGPFLAMPSRKLTDHCPFCREKNHLRARFCNGCGRRLDDERHLHRASETNGTTKLHADIAHPINVACRREIEQKVLTAFRQEIAKSQQPGYVPPRMDGDDMEFFDEPVSASHSTVQT